jgi:folate-binding protein YgfZ
MCGGSIELEEMKSGEDGTYANLIYYDPRGKQFGVRIVSMQPQLSVEGHFEHQSIEDHERLFQQLGEVPFEKTVGRLPFQFNYDLTKSISLKKGCFLGQEIVSRGLLAGIVRRRAFPFLLGSKT